MKTVILPSQADDKSPAGADIRYLVAGVTGNMIHRTVPPYQINRATVHAIVHKFWYILEGLGEIWRDNSAESSVTSSCPARPSKSHPAQLSNTATYLIQS